MKLLLALLCVTVAHALMKGSAPLLLGSRKLWPPLARMTALSAPVLLIALVITEVGKEGLHGIDTAILAGLGAAAVATLRYPQGILVPVVTGVAVTAVVRALTI